MEATKKKRAYLKPEMSRFEMKTQEFIAGSKEIIIDTPEELTMFLSPSCTQGGNGLQLNPGECSDDIEVNSDLAVNLNEGCNFWTEALLKKIDAVKGTKLRLCRKIDNPDEYVVTRK